MVSPGRTARMSPTATASSGTSSSCPSRTRRAVGGASLRDRKSTRLNSSHGYISYAVFCLKKKICGYGRAEKAQVQRMVIAILGLKQPPTPHHAADALAVAICHALAPPLLNIA